MPRLTIIYNELITLYDGEACEFNWSENETGIAVSAKTSTQQPKPSNGLLDLLAGASRQRTEARRRELSAEESE